ncbi:hypothetical protein OE88DRAFT_1667681 [Heliocybe sulcata]|uniref:Fungal-type protein kinase domain-containing protein n=1 Tax=Heliocybe sulcata TaxID=5364 RepID=A0A5C3MLT3_9AGAM|nr:hypothetical protein OE88DRAFT_1667681 [Heliocybe sulcata]
MARSDTSPRDPSEQPSRRSFSTSANSPPEATPAPRSESGLPTSRDSTPRPFVSRQSTPQPSTSRDPTSNIYADIFAPELSADTIFLDMAADVGPSVTIEAPVMMPPDATASASTPSTPGPAGSSNNAVEAADGSSGASAIEHVSDTPHGFSSDDHDRATVDALQKALSVELRGTAVFGDERFAHGLVSQTRLADMPADPVIIAFLKKCRLYNSRTRRWRGLPENSHDELGLYAPLLLIINAILKHFQRRDRVAIDTHGKTLPHSHRVYDTALKSSPDISLLGCGPAFSTKRNVQEVEADPQYVHMAAPIEVKREAVKNWTSHRYQLAVYARECLVQQPNRTLVLAALLTEMHLLLFQFDRVGAMFSRWVDIHHDALLFVKIILALSTADEGMLGFDTRIRWEGSIRYFKPHVADPLAYVIHNPLKPFRRHTIRGRGTTCWILEDPEGVGKLLLKLSWRTRDREPEWRFLKTIKDENDKREKRRKDGQGTGEENEPIPGIGSIVTYDEGVSLSSLRFNIALIPYLAPEQELSDRLYCSSLQRYYGPALEQAPSTLQSLRAFRDIIAGQYELYKLGIVHRDVSTRNMVYNPDINARPGQRGFLIDFDMAKRMERQSSMAAKDLRTGTRAFQSIKVLEGLGTQDYLDDLESSFWAYTWIACTSRSPGVFHPGIPESMINWGSDKLQDAVASKKVYLNEPQLYLYEARGMGRQVVRMLLELAFFFRETSIHRMRALQSQKMSDAYREMMEYASLGLPTQQSTSSASEQFNPEAQEHFSKVLAIVDGAIARQETDIAGGIAHIPIDPDRPAPTYVVTLQPGDDGPKDPIVPQREEAAQSDSQEGRSTQYESSSGSSNKRARRSESPSERQQLRRSQRKKMKRTLGQ